MMNDSAEHAPPPRMTLFERVIACRESDSNEALVEFFQAFWPAMYACLRSQGEAHTDGAAVVQNFVHQELTTGKQLRLWSTDSGRLRIFLKLALEEFRKPSHQAAPGNSPASTLVTFDFDWSQRRFDGQMAPEQEPDLRFDREWTGVIAHKSMAAVEKEYLRRGQAKEYRILSRSLQAGAAGRRRVSPAEIAHMLRTNEQTIRQKTHQLRRRYHHVFNNQVAETAAPSAADEEIKYISDLAHGLLPD